MLAFITGLLALVLCLAWISYLGLLVVAVFDSQPMLGLGVALATPVLAGYAIGVFALLERTSFSS